VLKNHWATLITPEKVFYVDYARFPQNNKYNITNFNLLIMQAIDRFRGTCLVDLCSILWYYERWFNVTRKRICVS